MILYSSLRCRVLPLRNCLNTASQRISVARIFQTPPLKRSWLRAVLPSFGGTKTSQSGPVSLLKQDGIPDELKLPLPGDPMSRLGAGVVDLIVAGTVGVLAGGVAQLVGADTIVVQAASQTAALGVWVLRDALSPDGNRSIGKRLFRLEIAYWDGALPPVARAAARNAYFLTLPLSQLHPLLEMVCLME